MKRITWIFIVSIVLLLIAGNTHRLLPAASDPCQQDLMHLDHLDELSMFHCLGHTEYEVAPGEKGLARVTRWEHVHPWMALDWHLAQGFGEAHARELLAHEP